MSRLIVHLDLTVGRREERLVVVIKNSVFAGGSSSILRSAPWEAEVKDSPFSIQTRRSFWGMVESEARSSLMDLILMLLCSGEMWIIW